MRFETPRGMDDLLPEEFAVKQRIVDVIREVYRLYGYEEVETPTLEYLELFEAKSGEEIRHRMFVFNDPHGRKLVLRPEVTASIARLVASKLSRKALPLRLGYIADCYRYDEPQWGRRRRFWQGGLELLGSRDPTSDVEILVASRDVFNKLGIRDYSFKIGHVGILRGLMDKVDQKIQDSILSYIDRKMQKEAFALAEQHVEPETLETMQRLTEMKGSREIVSKASDLLTPWEKARQSLENLSTILDIFFEIDQDIHLEVDLGFARGLEYYTGMIFEQKIVDEPLSFNGGGRYDGLVELFGGQPTPAVGCSIGITRIQMFLMKKKTVEYLETPSVVLAVVGGRAAGYGLRVADAFRSRGAAVAVDVVRRRLSDVIENAVNKGAKYLVIVGDNEMKDNKVTVRDLVAKTQFTGTLEEVFGFLKM
ncbi:MAG: histidine--tRNA ligase [Candidatus Caldarchaeum sp.]|nr:histidine--tRNA ligase [Candidatus Caldarchaeum sp.]MDW8435193.1 histidine--tRNA ligase [Candidatus Caldarchaeum sp.]